MENWIGAYRLPPNLGLGVQERGGEGGPGGEPGGPGGGVSPIPGTTPSPAQGLINMWGNIKVEQNHGHSHSLGSTGSIKGKGRSFRTFFSRIKYESTVATQNKEASA